MIDSVAGTFLTAQRRIGGEGRKVQSLSLTARRSSLAQHKVSFFLAQQALGVSLVMSSDGGSYRPLTPARSIEGNLAVLALTLADGLVMSSLRLVDVDRTERRRNCRGSTDRSFLPSKLCARTWWGGWSLVEMRKGWLSFFSSLPTSLTPDENEDDC